MSTDDSPTPMTVLLKVVEVVELQLKNNSSPARGSRDEQERAITIINKLGPGSIIGAVVHGSGKLDLSGGVMTTGDQYHISETQAGVIGPHGFAQHMTFTQRWDQGGSDIDLASLKDDLVKLRAAMREQATDVEHDISVAEIESAEKYASASDGPTALEHLAKAGRWALNIASAIGATVAAAAIKTALGI